MDYKIIISLVAVTLVFVGYAPYIRDTVKGKTVPHIFSWLVWTLAVTISWALQISGGAGVGAWTTGVTATICFIVLLLSIRNGNKEITKLDLAFLFLALTSLALWIFAKQPVLSVILIVSTDVFGFFPTIRKSWKEPHSETLFMYQITTIRHGLSIFALQQFNILTLLYPITWVLANLAFSVMLMIRRAMLKKDVEKN
ncbi:MAG: hypothetical protein V4467_03830 [Patescibacteria group bacterium]